MEKKRKRCNREGCICPHHPSWRLWRVFYRVNVSTLSFLLCREYNNSKEVRSLRLLPLVCLLWAAPLYRDLFAERLFWQRCPTFKSRAKEKKPTLCHSLHPRREWTIFNEYRFSFVFFFYFFIFFLIFKSARSQCTVILIIPFETWHLILQCCGYKW